MFDLWLCNVRAAKEKAAAKKKTKIQAAAKVGELAKKEFYF